MKADTGTGRIFAASIKGEHQVQNKAMKKNGKNERNDAWFRLIVVIEQWICLVLGIVCIVSGIRGAFLKLSQSALPAYPAWLAPEFVLTLRITALACFVMGLVLVRRGWGRF